MHNTNLFDTLNTFNKDDFKRFGDLVKSPFFNTNQTVSKLYDFIKKYFPDLQHKSLGKETAFKKLFPGEEYNDNRMRLLIHRLNSLAEEYLIQISSTQDKYWPKIFLLSALKSRKLFKAHEKHLEETREINYKFNKNTNEFYFVQHTIENSNIAAQIAKNLDANEKAIVNAQLSLTNKSLTCFTISTILKFSLFTENIRYRMKIEPQVSLIDEVLTHLKKHDYSDHPIVVIYYYLNMMIKEPDVIEHYINAKDVFFNNEDELHPFDRINIYINLENYLWKLYRKDHTKMPGELLLIYKRRLEKKNYKLGGYMPNQIYKRIVKSSLMKGDLKYAEKFIKEYKEELKQDFKEGIYNFACAMCSLHKKDYGKALEYLAVAQNEDISHKIDVKNLILFIDYEQRDFESLRLALDSYRHFIKNNQTISDQVKNRAATVIRFLNKFLKLNMEYDEFEVKKLKNEIDQCNDLENREWFIEKADCLSDKKPRPVRG